MAVCSSAAKDEDRISWRCSIQRESARSARRGRRRAAGEAAEVVSRNVPPRLAEKPWVDGLKI